MLKLRLFFKKSFLLLCWFAVFQIISAYDYEWNQPSDTYNSWLSIASDNTGEHLIAGGSSGGTFLSNTYGYGDWTLKTNGFIQKLASDDSGKNLVGIAYHVYISHNYGKNWTQTNTPVLTWKSIASDSTGRYLAACGYNSNNTIGYVYLSNDYGKNWKEVLKVKSSATAISIDKSGQNLVVGCSGVIVYYSRDYGVTWEKSPSTTSTSWFMTFVTNSTGQQVVGMTSTSPTSYIFISYDYGATWKATTAPSVYTNNGAYTGIACDASGKYIAATIIRIGIYMSSNYGATWTAITGIPTSNLYWMAITCDYSGMNWIGTLNGGTCPNDCGVFASNDYGVHWHQVSTTLTTSNALVSNVDLTHVFSTVSAYASRLYSSTDFGITWIADVLPSGVTVVAIDSTGQHLAIAVKYDTIYTSHDYGDTWMKSNAPIGENSQNGLYWSAIFSDGSGKNLTACLSTKVYQSTDYGMTWNLRTQLGPYSDSNHYCTSITGGTNAKHLAVSAANYIYISKDYGLTWSVAIMQQVNNYLPYPYYIASSSDGKYMVASTVLGLYTSINYGQVWNISVIVGSSSYLYQGVASDSTGQYLAACYQNYMTTGDKGYIFTSSNFGGNWIKSFASSAKYKLITSDDSGERYVATNSDNGYFLASTVSPTSQPTSQPSTPTSKPSSQPFGHPTSQPSSIPSRSPSRQPSARPSCQPSSSPSSSPSSVPTTYPTLHPVSIVTNQVTTNFKTATTLFTKLGYESNNIFYLTVAVIPTGVPDSVGAVTVNVVQNGNGNEVSVGSCTLPSTCNTSVAYYYCFYNQDISSLLTNFVSPAEGGTITVTFTGITSAASCPVNGNSFNAIATLSKNIEIVVPTAMPSNKPFESSENTFGTTPSSDLVSTNIPFVFSVVIALAAGLFGISLISNRFKDKDADLYNPSQNTTILHFGLFTCAYVSQIFFAYVCFSHANFLWFGVAWLVVRIASIFMSIILLIKLFTKYQNSAERFDKRHFLNNRKLYTILSLLCVFDINLIKYMCWKKTDYVVFTGGFPDEYVFTMCTFTSIVCSLCISLLQFIFTLYTFENSDHVEGFAMISLYFSFALAIVKATVEITEYVFVKCFTKDQKVKRDSMLSLTTLYSNNEEGVSSSDVTTNTTNTKDIFVSDVEAVHNPITTQEHQPEAED